MPTDHLLPNSTDPDKKAVLNLYSAFGVALVLSLVPSALVSLVALFFLLGVLISAYRMRKKFEMESLGENHTTYIIRTIWIGTLFSVISVSAAGIYMLSGIDYTAFQPCAEGLAAQGADAANASFDVIWGAAEPCFDNFINENFKLLSISALVAAGPIILYFAYRYAKGLTRALKGYRIMNAKAWF